MVKKIMHDPLFLAQKSVDATEADKQIVTDLLDTLRANLEHCVGMAANMIGEKKNIIVVAAGPFQFAMITPIITTLWCLTPHASSVFELRCDNQAAPSEFEII